MKRNLHCASATAGALMALIGITSRAAAKEAPKVELHYAVRNVPGCLSEREFRDAVRRRFDDDPLADHAPLVLTTEIARVGSRLRATVSLQERGTTTEATQEILAHPGECVPLSASAALAVSLAIKRARVRVASSPPDSPSDAPSESPSESPSDSPPARLPGSSSRPALPSRVSRPEAPRSPKPSRRLEVRTHASVSGALGTLPSLSVGESFGASLKVGRWFGSLEAGAWLPSSVSTPAGNGGKAWLLFLAGSGCAYGGRLFVCALGTAGDFRAIGTGQLLSHRASSAYVALGARVGVEIPLARPFALVVQGSLLAPLVRPGLRIGEEVLWQVPFVTGDLGLGLRVSIL